MAWLLDERRAVQLLDTSGENTYRLFHEALREHLRAAVVARTGSRAANSVMMRTLVAHVPTRGDGEGPDWTDGSAVDLA